MNAPVITPAFAHLLPEQPLSPLHNLIEEAIAAQDEMRSASALFGERYLQLKEDQAFDARRALLDHLLNEHGIPSSLAKRIGEVL